MDRPKDEGKRPIAKTKKYSMENDQVMKSSSSFPSWEYSTQNKLASTEGTTKLGCSLSPSEVIIKKRALKS